MLRAAICSFMKLSIFTGDAFAPIFQTKSPVARYNSISSTDCFSFLPFTSLLSYRPRESPDCGSFGNEHFFVVYLSYIRELYIHLSMRHLLGG